MDNKSQAPANTTPSQSAPATPPAAPASPAPITFPVQNPNQAPHSAATTPPATTAPNQNPVKALNKLPLIIIGTLMILGIIIGGFFIFNQMNSSPKNTGPAPTTYDVPRGS